MYRSFASALVALSLFASAPAWAAPVPASVYAAPAMYSDVAISPSGKLIAMVAQKDSLYVLRVYDADRLKDGPRAEYRLGPAPSVNWVRWKSDERLLFSVSVPDGSLKQVVTQTRLMSVDPGLKSFVNVAAPPRNYIEIPTIQDDVVSFLPNDPNAILLAIDWRTPWLPGVRKVDIRTGASMIVRDRDQKVTGWVADADGTPRLALGDYTKSKVPDHFRIGDDGSLKAFSPKVPEDARVGVIGFDRTPSRLVVTSDHEGGTRGLYVYDLDKDAFAETLFKDARYDVRGAVYSPDGRAVVGVSYVTDQHEVRYLDPAYAAKMARAEAIVGGSGLAVLDATPDGERMIVARREGGRTVESWWVDLKAGEARSLGRYDAALDAAPMGKVVAVSYKARDGLDIPAYVTLPVGVERLEDARALPFVVMPHGGPHARDTAEYDWWAQFLASRGYAVLQPNFRGSTGYGEAFRDAGRRQWGQAIQDDVADGARWLAAQGYADANRMCVAGGSFGGYTALVASFRDADLYRCAVSLAGVSDLEQLIQEERMYYGGETWTRALIGRAWRDGDELKANSPALQAAKVAMPVLIVHGTADSVVPVEHGRKMRDRLQAAGKAVTYRELDLADHSLSREKDRLAFLSEVEAFLARNIGPGATK